MTVGQRSNDDRDRPDLSSVTQYVNRSNELRNGSNNEEVVKANLFHHLPLMFPGQPGWLAHHIAGVEAHLHVADRSRSMTFSDSLVGSTAVLSRFSDSLVGLTSVEYEPDLRRADRFAGGLEQVREHCAGLLNRGHLPDKIVGILSDTVLWIAYSVRVLREREPGGYGIADIELVKIDEVDTSTPSPSNERDLVEFLLKHLGRTGSRPLSAQTIVSDLGAGSRFGSEHLAAVNAFVRAAFARNPPYGALIEELWVRFVAVAGSGAESVPFDGGNYGHELYLVTLAKLICANVLAGRALRSSDSELMRILSGEYFRNEGLDNLVEYDYFGWLSDLPCVEDLVPVTSAIQEDLHAYDFSEVPVEDLFGHLMAELGRRSQRLLLGQEFTPSWLCTAMASQLLADLPSGEIPRFIDMCCGSGAMLVAVTQQYGAALIAQDQGPGNAEALQSLAESATGFDIDPLAVLLAKVNWVVANRAWLIRGEQVSIPVYHADSLFTGAPFAESGGQSNELKLSLHRDVDLTLPVFLVEPEQRQLFDDLLQHAYALSRAASDADLEPAAVEAASRDLLDTATDLDDSQRESARQFFSELVVGLHRLQIAGLNGLWAFILKNSYRPALVAGQFNGLIANPPWLALSKVARNPYGIILRALASRLALSPPGPAHLHTELSTTFLYASVDRYLAPNAVVACVLPDAVLNGYQHKPFRVGAPEASAARVRFNPSRIWRIARGTFKNEAIVVFGSKSQSARASVIPGGLVSRQGLSTLSFRVLERGNRLVWNDADGGASSQAFFDAGDFRQGADLMPRTLLFHDLQQRRGARWSVGAIDRHASPLRYLVKDAKKYKDFAITSGTVADRYVFDALLSNHLTPFDLADPARILLPFEHSGTSWSAVTTQGLAADPASADVFRRIHAELGATVWSEDLLHLVETDRSKLSIQQIPASGYLVVYGAGGGVVCAAFRPLATLRPERIVIDQTLYWHVVDSEDEALYLSGLFNSPAIESLISAFQPQGQQKERHIHRLPALVTPKFDPGDPAHQAVVTTTRALVLEWSELLDSHSLDDRLDPCKALAGRRSYLRGRLAALNSFREYATSCEALYRSSVLEAELTS
jgi:hypothetical protein